MPVPRKKAADNDKVALYDKLIATMPKLERKGAANPYTALNGNMFALLHQSKALAIRLPEQETSEVHQEAQVPSVRSLWGGHERVRRRARRFALQHERTAEISDEEL